MSLKFLPSLLKTTPTLTLFLHVEALDGGEWLINPRRACAARVPVLALCVCLCVCLSVTALAATAFVSACNQRHLRHYFRLFLDFNSWIFEKAFRYKSYGEKKPICKLVRAHREPFSRIFGTNETQQLREGQLVGRMLLQRLATGVKQARYRRSLLGGQRGTRTRMRSGQCMVILYATYGMV